MRVVLPLSHSDIDKLPDWIRVVSHLGGVAAHRLIIIPTLSASKAAHDAASKLMNVFGQVEVKPLDHDPSGGWPTAPNYQFFMSAITMGAEQGPWLWVEADCLPIRSNWLDAIGAAWASNGTPCLGHVDKAPWRDDVTHQILESPYGPTDTILNGCAVYPHNLSNHPNTKALMDDFAKGPDATTDPFDVYLRAGIRAMGCSHTNLIASHWNTYAYRLEGNRLVCTGGSSHSSTPEGWPIRNFGGPIHPDAVLVHGCKDKSLAEIVLGAGVPSFALLPKPAAQSTEDSTEMTELKVQLAESKSEMAELKLMMRQLLSRPAPTPEPPQDEVIEIAPPSPSQVQEAVLKALSGKGTLQIGVVEKKTGLTRQSIRNAAKAKESAFAITGPGWVKLKKAS